jgi:tetratricopeptide (TPR) repeat protein
MAQAESLASSLGSVGADSITTQFTLISTDHLRVDYACACDVPVAVAFTFNAWGSKTLLGYGYAGEFLLKNRFAIVAFKSNRNYWYQDITEEQIATVNEHLRRLRPGATRVGYGSSMGAYAAIQFSGAFALERVLAISPQFEIDQPWEQRWAADAAKIEFRHRISAASINPSCAYFLVYDPLDRDGIHAEKIREAIPAQRFRDVPIQFSGHPSTFFLAETSLVKDFALQILGSGTVPDFESRKSESKTYLFNLAKATTKEGKFEEALKITEKALAIEGSSPHLPWLKSLLLDRLGNLDSAVEWAKIAVERVLNGEQQKANLARLLEKQRRKSSPP